MRVPFVLLLAPALALSQQVADTSFRPTIASPAHARGTGPIVVLDEAHRNFHTLDGRYRPFGMLLERDGYVVRPNRSAFSRSVLDSARLLVIANAIAPENAQGNWVRPIRPAFRADEVRAVRDWVTSGGSLLLIADHMPMAGAADSLAAAFGVFFVDGFAQDSSQVSIIRHRRADGALGSHPVLSGRNPRERIDSLTAFTGQAFRVVGNGTPLMTLGRGTVVLMPDTAWQFSDRTPRIRADGMLQGVAMEVGRGRVVMLGEAAMMSAQLAGPQRNPMGMNHPAAAQNAQFVLNVVRWLTRAY
jgi:hypothetical protein